MKAQDSSLDTKALEAALPELTKKLMELKYDLDEDQQAVLSSIVSSAALHLKSMSAIESTAEISYAKPISAVASVKVRDTLVDLPRQLGFVS